MIPIGAQFEITERCNHRCIYCYNFFRDQPNPDNPRLVEVAERIATSDLFYIVITGGEPLMAEKLHNICSVLSANNVDFSLNTNLTCLTDEKLEFLLGNNIISILTSAISYDADTHDNVTLKRGSHKRLLRNLKRVKEAGIPAAVNMVINQLNKDQVYETGKFFMDSFGINSFCATPVVPAVGTNTDQQLLSPQEYTRCLDDLLRLHDDTGVAVETLNPPIPCMFDDPEKYTRFLNRCCVAGRHTLTFSADGQVRPCSHSDESYGNILEQDLSNIFARINKWKDKSLIPNECATCSEVAYCRGGCRVAASVTDGNLDAKHPYFRKPLMKKINREYPTQSKLPDFRSSYVAKKQERVRYRKEPNGNITVYVRPRAFATLDPIYFKLFKYLYSSPGKNLNELKIQLGIGHNHFVNALRTFLGRKILQLSHQN